MTERKETCITLHYITSYLEWPKYKTAKPLQYTAYRTRNGKQLVKKWSGEKESFEAIPKNSQHWSWGNVRRQTVPEAATSHQKCSIADGVQPCTSNHQLRGWRRPKTAAVGVSDTLDVVKKIPWCQTVQASVNEHSQLEIDAFRRPQPVKVLQHRCDVLIASHIPAIQQLKTGSRVMSWERETVCYSERGWHGENIFQEKSRMIKCMNYIVKDARLVEADKKPRKRLRRLLNVTTKKEWSNGP